MAKDVYANSAVITVTESAANTLTFKKLETGVSLGGRMAWIIHAIDYMFASPAAATFNGDSDALSLGICQTNSFATAIVTEPAILDYIAISRLDFGAAATSISLVRPFRRDFSILPGGGLVVVPNPFYGFAQGTGLAAATTSYIKIYYTEKEVTDQDFYDLWQSRVQLSA